MMDDAKTKNGSDVEVTYRLRVSNDKLKVFLSSPPVTGDIDSLVEQIFRRLREMMVTAKYVKKA